MVLVRSYELPVDQARAAMICRPCSTWEAAPGLTWSRHADSGQVEHRFRPAADKLLVLIRSGWPAAVGGFRLYSEKRLLPIWREE